MMESDECRAVRTRIVVLNDRLKEVRPIPISTGQPGVMTDDLRDQMRYIQDEIAEAEQQLEELSC